MIKLVKSNKKWFLIYINSIIKYYYKLTDG